MKNRFLRRGILLLLSGMALIAGGYYLKNHSLDFYGWLMIAGVVLFGVGFINVFYSLVRKVEAQGIKEERAEEKEKKRKFWLESRKTKRAVQA